MSFALLIAAALSLFNVFDAADHCWCKSGIIEVLWTMPPPLCHIRIFGMVDDAASDVL